MPNGPPPKLLNDSIFPESLHPGDLFAISFKFKLQQKFPDKLTQWFIYFGKKEDDMRNYQIIKIRQGVPKIDNQEVHVQVILKVPENILDEERRFCRSLSERKHAGAVSGAGTAVKSDSGSVLTMDRDDLNEQDFLSAKNPYQDGSSSSNRSSTNGDKSPKSPSKRGLSKKSSKPSFGHKHRKPSGSGAGSGVATNSSIAGQDQEAQAAQHQESDPSQTNSSKSWKLANMGKSISDAWKKNNPLGKNESGISLSEQELEHKKKEQEQILARDKSYIKSLKQDGPSLIANCEMVIGYDDCCESNWDEAISEYFYNKTLFDQQKADKEAILKISITPGEDKNYFCMDSGDFYSVNEYGMSVSNFKVIDGDNKNKRQNSVNGPNSMKLAGNVAMGVNRMSSKPPKGPK